MKGAEQVHNLANAAYEPYKHWNGIRFCGRKYYHHDLCIENQGSQTLVLYDSAPFLLIINFSTSCLASDTYVIIDILSFKNSRNKYFVLKLYCEMKF